LYTETPLDDNKHTDHFVKLF